MEEMNPGLTGEEAIPPEAEQSVPLPEVNVDNVEVEQPSDADADDEAASDPPVDEEA